jgi:superfamily II DNA/RNA helicase
MTFTFSWKCINKMNKFKELGINEEILKSIERLNYKEPTEIQKQTIPLMLEGKDVIAQSATGSGKTLCFGSAIIENIAHKNKIQALIMTPTRELAEQIFESMKTFSKYRKLKIAVIYGGVSYNPQFKALETADIVVGTPGRLLDHLERRTMNLSNVGHLVLDEADRMLDMGFLDDVGKIISQCKKEKQTMFFSATFPSELDALATRFMNNPTKVVVDCYVDPKKLKQVYYNIDNNMKFSLLVHLLKKENTGLVMVFCNSRHSTDFVTNGLSKQGIKALAIHGGLTQNKRTNVIKKFNSKATFVLVCTDVAARGLDIPGVSHVYNYDIPNESKQYVHRIGRTARAGESGIAINLLSNRDHDNFAKVLQEFDVNIEKLERPYIEKVKLSLNMNRNRNGRSFSGRSGNNSGGRPSGNYGRGNASNASNHSGSQRFSKSNRFGKKKFGSRDSSRPKPEMSNSIFNR